MSIMNRLAWRSMWQNKTRTIVTIIGIILSAAMFTAVTTLGVSLLSYLVDITVYNTGDYYIRFDNVTAEQLEQIEAREEITTLGIAKTLGYTNVGTQQQNQSYIVAALDETAFTMRPIHLIEGRLPEASGEIVIPEHCLWYLEAAGMGCKPGDILTIDVVPQYVDEYYFEYMPDFPIEDIPNFTRTYVIVGIVENESSRLDDCSMEPMNFITVDDGSYADYHWARAFAKTEDPMDAYMLQEEGLANICSVNTELLNYYGASKYSNLNELIYTVCAILMVIILIGSISLIYNAFSISLAERSRDFGLLCSVGATKRQLRRSVYFEALCLSAIAVPIGIICGYFGIAVTLWLTGDLISGLLVGSVQSGAVFRAVPEPAAFLCAGAVAVLTVLISAWIPLKRAVKADPIRSIRQTGDYQVPKKGIRDARLSARFFGAAGLMSNRYYSVSRKKYRTTVISLTISVVLFLTSVGFTNILKGLTEVNTNNFNYDFSISADAYYDAIRDRADVERSALVARTQHLGFFGEGVFSEEYLELTDRTDSRNVNVCFLEDEVFRAFLEEQGIDPEPYFTSAVPLAICCPGRITVYEELAGNGLERRVYTPEIFRTEDAEVLLFSTYHPEALSSLLDDISGGWSTEYSIHEGSMVQTFLLSDSTVPEELPINADGSLSVIRIPRTQEDSTTVVDFHYFSMDTMEIGERIFTEEDPELLPGIRIRDQVSELPFGIDEYSGWILTVVLPMSRQFGDQSVSLHVKVADYDSLHSWLEENLEEYQYSDYLHSQVMYRNLVTMINIFTYGFILLISLICVCNVFNTISTNIALRRRDFGMLRSVGMTVKELDSMMALECARYGVMALIIGIPLGLGIGYGIYVLLDISSSIRYSVPWNAVGLAVLCVFTVVFITMLYAVAKLRKDNPIDAIRMENLY